MSQTLESIYQLTDIELKDYIESNDHLVDTDPINNRLIATILNYNNGTLKPEDAWYVQQERFNELYTTQIIDLGKIANSQNLVLWNGINSLDMIRSILTKIYLEEQSSSGLGTNLDKQQKETLGLVDKGVLDGRGNISDDVWEGQVSENITKIEKRKILIVGAGPVGLFLAVMIIQNTKLNKLYDVCVIERRYKYDREQVILINNESYNLLPYEVRYNIWLKNDHPGCFVLPPSKERGAFCFKDKLELSSAPLFIIEEALYEYIVSSGIKVYRPNEGEEYNIDMKKDSIRVNDVNIDYDILVGADGANSLVRSEMLGGYIKEVFSPLWGLTIIDHIEPEKLRGIYNSPTDIYKSIVERNEIQNNYRIFRTTYGLLYIALILNNSEAISVKKYIDDKTLNIPDWLRTKVNQLCKQIQTTVCPELKRETLNIFSVNPSYSTKSSEMREKPIYLVGDSLVNTNFFTGSGVNVGFTMAKNLAELLGIYTHGYIPDEIYKNKQKPEVNKIFAQVTGIQNLEGAKKASIFNR